MKETPKVGNEQMKYSNFSSVVIKEILFCACKERWRSEVVNIKTFSHSSGKAEKPRSGNGARSAREGREGSCPGKGRGGDAAPSEASPLCQG